MIVELHLLQAFPTSNLNRDDVGQPKSVTFGGAQRGRISSQCLKRSARLLFPEVGLDPANTGVRTKRLVERTAKVLDGLAPDDTRDPSADALDLAREAVRLLGFDVDQRDLTQYLFYLGRRAVDELVEFCRNHEDDLRKAAAASKAAAKKREKKQQEGEAAPKREKTKLDSALREEADAVLDASKAADIALFGRMVADNKDFNVDAASQVAHAISTHAVATEFDYYTAVDDLKPEESAGADMIGTVDFTAPCFYRYANLNVDQLARNLTPARTASGPGGQPDTELVNRTTAAWLRAFIKAVPSGKQNSMAALTLPDTLLAVVRTQGSWNLANAFLAPVTGTDVMRSSARRLLSHFGDLRGFYGDGEITGVAAASVSHPDVLDHDALAGEDRTASLEAFIARVTAAAQV